MRSEDGNAPPAFRTDAPQFPQIVLTEADLRSEPRCSNTRLVWSYRRRRISAGLRFQITQTLREDGPMTLAKLMSAVRIQTKSAAAVFALACADLVELDLGAAPIGPYRRKVPRLSDVVREPTELGELWRKRLLKMRPPAGNRSEQIRGLSATSLAAGHLHIMPFIQENECTIHATKGAIGDLPNSHPVWSFVPVFRFCRFGRRELARSFRHHAAPDPARIGDERALGGSSSELEPFDRVSSQLRDGVGRWPNSVSLNNSFHIRH